MRKGYDHCDLVLSLITGQSVLETGTIWLYGLKACALLLTRDEGTQNDESDLRHYSGFSCQFSDFESRASIEGNQ